MARERADRLPPEEAVPPQEGKESLIRAGYAFTGQGSHFVGMGQDLNENSPAARDIFKRANYALGFNLLELMFKGPQKDLGDTINSQPAILAVSMAALAASEEKAQGKMPVPVFVAGHSLGQYTACVAEEVMTLEEGLLLVRERGRLMQEASRQREGRMAAIIGILDELALQHILAETGVELANTNSDDQIVFSGDKKALARACDLAMARGASKIIPLPVEVAFHSRDMQPAQQGLRDAISKLNLKDPNIPIVANSQPKALTNGKDIGVELVDGLCRNVDWRGDVHFMTDRGVNVLIEFGPKKVLSSLAKRINTNLNAFTIDSSKSLTQLAS